MGTWRYAILDKGGYFEVCEEYLNDDGSHMAYAESGPGGETPQELLEDLERALKDVKQAIEDGRVVEEAEATSFAEAGLKMVSSLDDE